MWKPAITLGEMSVTFRARTYRVPSVPSLRVAHLALACCALEVEAAVHAGLLEPVDEAPPSGGPDVSEEHTVLLVSGTVTEALAPAVTAAVADLPGRVSVMAVGACATSGGPYWDAPSVVPGVDRLVPVHAYVPGCPPRPDALLAALAEIGGSS